MKDGVPSQQVGVEEFIDYKCVLIVEENNRSKSKAEFSSSFFQ